MRKMTQRKRKKEPERVLMLNENKFKHKPETKVKQTWTKVGTCCHGIRLSLEKPFSEFNSKTVSVELNKGNLICLVKDQISSWIWITVLNGILVKSFWHPPLEEWIEQYLTIRFKLLTSKTRKRYCNEIMNMQYLNGELESFNWFRHPRLKDDFKRNSSETRFCS